MRYRINGRKMVRFVANTLAVIGGVIIYGAIGTTDLYSLELRTKAPADAWEAFVLGGLLVLPLVVRMLCEALTRGGNNHVDR